MQKKSYPQPPKIFFCEQCKVFFFTFSRMTKPTHPKCAGHKTRLATDKEVNEINLANQTHFCKNGVVTK